MSHIDFDHIYDPVATPNPAYDDDFEPTPAPTSSWDRRNLAQTLLQRARARQEAIADAFVEALLDGKIAFFRILIDLEQAAIAAEAEAEDARRPGLADILLPMLQRERAQAAANAAQDAAQHQAPPASHPQSIQPIPSLTAPAYSESTGSAPPQPGATDIQATADHPPADSHPCRSRTVAHNRRRTKSRNHRPSHANWKGSPETSCQLLPATGQNTAPLPQSPRRKRRPHSVSLTLRSLTAVAAPEATHRIRIPIRFQSYGHHPARQRISHRNLFKQNELHA